METSLRDKIAIAAMNGELASQSFGVNHQVWANEKDLAKRAYEIADAMLKEADKNRTK